MNELPDVGIWTKTHQNRSLLLQILLASPLELSHKELKDLQSIFAMMLEALETRDDKIGVIFDSDVKKSLTFNQSCFVGLIKSQHHP